MAEDDVPLPKTKGSYDIDFDALDDSFDPFGTTKKLRNSPPVDEQVVRGAVVPDSEPARDPEVSGGVDSQVAGANNVESTPKKAGEAENNVDSAVDTPSASAGSNSQDAGDGVPPMPAAEIKPVKKKTKVVKKPKSRPVSKNFEGQPGPEVEIHVAGQPPCSGANPADGDMSCPALSATPSQQVQGHGDASATTADREHLQPTPENTALENSTPEKSTPKKSAMEKPKKEKSTPQKVTPSESEAEKQTLEKQTPEKQTPEEQTPEKQTPEKQTPEKQTPEKQTPEKQTPEKQTPEKPTPEKQTPEKSEAEMLAPESSTRVKSPRPAKGSESVPRREKSGGKVKKTKHRSSRRSGSHSEGTDGTDGVHRRDSEGRDSGSDLAPPERGAKGSPRSSTSSLTGEPYEPAVAGQHKNKHPAARVLEQQQLQGELAAHHADAASLGGKQCLSPQDSDLESFYDAYDSPPDRTGSLVPEMEHFNEMDDSRVLFQSQDYLSWSQDEDALLDEGGGEGTVADDLISGESEMADVHSNQSVVKLVQDSKKSGQVLKYSQSEWNKLKQELELGFQAQLLAKEREWGIKLADRDSRLATLEDNNKKLRQTNEDMRVVVAEFEKTISQLQSEKEKTSNASQQSLQDVVKERDQALEDLQSVETAFSDLHRRYEKTKAVVEGFKQNEDVLKKCVADLQNKLKKTEQKVQMVKTQAEEKLEKATEEIERVQKSTSSEMARLEAALRKAELQVQSQEALLEQKVKENTELAAICDELIAKV